MSRDRAAYMREYRKRKRPEPLTVDLHNTATLVNEMDAEIAALRAELARLKRELADRPAAPAFNSRPFRPVPK